MNNRLDEIHAAVLRVKLRHLDTDTERRRTLAEELSVSLANRGLILPEYPSDREAHAWHLYVVRSKERENFMQQMANEGIECGIHYPIPIHHQGAYSEYRTMSFPIAERQAIELVSYPIFQ